MKAERIVARSFAWQSKANLTQSNRMNLMPILQNDDELFYIATGIGSHLWSAM